MQQPSPSPSPSPGAASPAYEKLSDDELLQRQERMDEIQRSMSSWRMPREWVIAVASVLVVLTSGGLILGFGPVYSLLVEEGQWREKCTPDELADETALTCPQQEVYLQYIYSTAFLCLSAANAFFGIFLDVAGPRTIVLMGLLISMVGMLMLAYGDSKSGNGMSIIVGYSLVGIGGFPTYIASFQLVQLFERQGVLCSFISGLFNSSGYVFMLLMIGGISRQTFFLAYTFIILASLVVCMVVFPLHSLSKPSSHLTLSGFKCRLPIFVKPTGLWPGLKQQLVRKDLWYFGIYFGWISTIFAFAGSALANIIYKYDNGDDDTAADYVNYLFPIIMNGTFIYTPLVGYVIDHWGFKPVFLLTLVLVHLFLGSLMVHSMQFQIVSLILFAMAQSSFYSLQFAYIVICFPGEVYGSLQAFLAVCSFTMGLLNYIFTPWVQNGLDGNYTPVLLLMAGPVLVFYFFLGLVKTGLDKPKTVASEKV